MKYQDHDYGYFDSFKCYNYSSEMFIPSAVTLDKKCLGNWSGDFLNYLTTKYLQASSSYFTDNLRPYSCKIH